MLFRTARNIGRLFVIGRTLARYNALPETLPQTAPGFALFWRWIGNAKEPGRVGQRLARALADLGPTYIKLGQLLSTRSDLVGERMALDLAELQDKLPPFPGAPSPFMQLVEQCKVALEDGRRRSLAEVRFEYRGEREPATLSATAGAISPRRHRRGR